MLGPLDEQHAEHDRGDEQHERGAAPVEAGRDDRDAREQPDPPRQPQRLLDRLTRGVGRRCRARARCLRSCARPGPGSTAATQPQSFQLPAGHDLLVPHALRHVWRAISGSDHTAVSATATAPTGNASRHVRRGPPREEQQQREQREDHRDDDVRHRRRRDQHRGQPRPLPGVEGLAERAQREQAERERERERELARERAGDVAAVDLPVRRGSAPASPCAATANAGGAGHGARRPRANEYALAGSSSAPETVTSLNATLYGTNGIVSSERDRAPPAAGSSTARPGTPRTSPATSPTAGTARTSAPSGTTATRRGRPCRRRWWSCSRTGRRSGSRLSGQEPHPGIHDPDHDAHAQRDDAEPDGPLPAGPSDAACVRRRPAPARPRGVDILQARLVHGLTACQPGCRDRLHLLMDD